MSNVFFSFYRNRRSGLLEIKQAESLILAYSGERFDFQEECPDIFPSSSSDQQLDKEEEEKKKQRGVDEGLTE